MDSPYLNDCHFDAAGELLKFIYTSRSLTKAAAQPSSLHVFDQTEFTGSSAGVRAKTMLASEGYVYIPEKCRAPGATCPVHVALHGCLQAAENVQDAFVRHAGYNEWAEGSGLIVIYPQAIKGPGNPNACFDWWGYTGPSYATKSGAQMKAIKAMIDRVSAF
jgi:poly(3-hydroxybutyrate) depolymerase